MLTCTVNINVREIMLSKSRLNVGDIFFLQHYKKVLWNTFIPMITLGFVSKKKITAVQYQYHLNNSLLRHSCERCIGNREISLPIYCYSCHSILYSKITIATESAVQLKACSHMI